MKLIMKLIMNLTMKVMIVVVAISTFVVMADSPFFPPDPSDTSLCGAFIACYE